MAARADLLHLGEAARDLRLVYGSGNAIISDADSATTEAAMNFFRDVTYEGDYIIGLKIQKGLASGAHADITFGRNEHGTQHFREWLNWHLRDDDPLPKLCL